MMWLKLHSHGIDALLGVGPNPPPPPPRGNCTLYSAVSSTGPSADPKAVSGGPAIVPPKVTLALPVVCMQ